LLRRVLGWIGAFAYTTLLSLAPDVDSRILPGLGLASALWFFLPPRLSRQRRYPLVREAVSIGAAYLWVVAVVLLKPLVPEVTSVVARFMSRPATFALAGLPVALALGIGLARLIQTTRSKRSRPAS